MPDRFDSDDEPQGTELTMVCRISGPCGADLCTMQHVTTAYAVTRPNGVTLFHVQQDNRVIMMPEDDMRRLACAILGSIVGANHME